MKNKEIILEWLKRAESNYAIAKRGRTSKKILFDDLCFECQQTVEKALKGLLIFYDLEFYKTHDISLLLKTLKNTSVDIPKIIYNAEELTQYAKNSRYPGNYDPATSVDYKSSLKIAEKVLQWAKSIIENKHDHLF